jgi:hypothetical protein
MKNGERQANFGRVLDVEITGLNDSVGGPDYSPEHAPFRLLLRNDRPELAQGRRDSFCQHGAGSMKNGERQANFGRVLDVEITGHAELRRPAVIARPSFRG